MLSLRMACSIASAVPSFTHSVARAFVTGLAITVVARKAPARRCVCCTFGQRT